MKVVYFIQRGSDGPIKIGGTRGDPKVRMAVFQTASPEKLRLLGCVPGEESAARAIFKAHWISGEWFRPHRDILDFVRGRTAKVKRLRRQLRVSPPSHDALRVSVEAKVSHRTVERYLGGANVRPVVELAIQAAAKKLKIKDQAMPIRLMPRGEVEPMSAAIVNAVPRLHTLPIRWWVSLRSRQSGVHWSPWLESRLGPTAGPSIGSVSGSPRISPSWRSLLRGRP